MTERIISPKSTPQYPNLIYTPDMVEGTTTDLTYLKDDSVVTTPISYAIRAMGSITLTDIPHLNDTFIIDTQSFKWVTSRSVKGEVTIGDTIANCITNIYNAVYADSKTVISGPATPTITISCWEAGSIGNTIDFTHSTNHMTMDGEGHLGGTIIGVDNYDLLESFSITGKGFPAIISFNDILLASYGHVVAADWASVKYYIYLYNDTTDTKVFEVTIRNVITNVSFWNFQPAMRTIEILENGQDYVLYIYFGTSQYLCASCQGESTSRIITFQEIKR